MHAFLSNSLLRYSNESQICKVILFFWTQTPEKVYHNGVRFGCSGTQYYIAVDEDTPNNLEAESHFNSDNAVKFVIKVLNYLFIVFIIRH